MKNKWKWCLLSLLIVIVDQGLKLWAQYYFMPYEPYAVSSMLNITLAYNTGVAFSFLSDGAHWSRWGLAAFSLIMSLGVLIWLKRTEYEDKKQLLALSFILGGAVGNLIDRAFLGHVIDFIDVYVSHYHWPIFNLADSAICCGAILLLTDLKKERAQILQ